MNSSSTRPRGRPSRIDSPRTLRTALELLDESGLDALTMRRLADAMEVRAGALYRYYATKQELLTAMSEQMMEGVTEKVLATDGAPWHERVADFARALRAALLNHRDGARVFAGTHPTGGNVLGFSDALVGVLLDAGFPADDAARTLYTLSNFTVGHTLEEQAARSEENGGPGAAGLLRSAVTDGSYPHLHTAVTALASTDFDRHFEYGLGLIIDGLKARRPALPAGSGQSKADVAIS
ncbi:TetR family transcriptional regulator [Streptomyces sp. M1013]|uniref:TetR/AcrR family transcriptional regulator n=1 Tax=Streptomyces sp. M1013 TaxID=549798 RepID=UPI000978DAEA|nr:TetR/AcrR family transcriptional regulator [Streptomyces sp. M1013]OMI84894.1 TetR family transcriptional regulator [Streptomyces sp. M1013]